jgi:hypothetical protein
MISQEGLLEFFWEVSKMMDYLSFEWLTYPRFGTMRD